MSPRNSSPSVANRALGASAMLPVLLLIALPSVSSGQRDSTAQGEGPPLLEAPGPMFEVTDYGAVADAVEASNCDPNEDVPLACDTPGTGTVNAAAFQAAIDAACAVDGGVVFIPDGKYRLERTVNVACSNLWLTGSRDAVVLPGAIGVTLFHICPASENGSCVDSARENLTGIRVFGFTIRDDDPIAHGCSTCEQVSLDTTGIDGTFIYGETLTFGSTGPAGGRARFYYSDSNEGTLIYDMIPANATCGGTFPSTGCSGTVTGDRSGATATISSTDYFQQFEESAGIDVQHSDGTVIEDLRIEFIGDESILLGAGSVGAIVRNNSLWHVPGAPSAGSGIDITNGASGFEVTGNSIVLGLGRSNKGIAVVPTDIDITSGKILSNTITEPQAGNRDHSVAEYGIDVDASGADSSGLEISDNVVDVDIQTWGTCSITTSVQCNEHSDCLPVEHCTNEGDDGAGAALFAYESDGNRNSGNAWLRNRVHGPVYISELGPSKMTRVEGNTIESSAPGVATGLRVDATNALVADNLVEGFHGKAFVNVATDTLTLSNNTFSDVGADLRGIGALITIADTFDSVAIVGNAVTAALVTHPPATIRGIQCGPNDSGTLVITDNTITGTDETAIYGCHGVIANNDIDGTGHIGIWLTGPNDDGSIVSGNEIAGTVNHGIYLEGVNGVTLTGNDCLDVGSYATASCIKENWTAGDAEGNTLVNNHSAGSGGTGAPFSASRATGGGCDGSGGDASTCSGNVVDSSPASTLLESGGSLWRYYDAIPYSSRDYPPADGEGDAWHEAAFDDSGWAIGSGLFGYGDLDGNTPDTLLDNGQGGETCGRRRPCNITYLLRTTFDLTSLPGNLTATIRSDDGFILYLNGLEVARRNLDDPVDAGTFASSSVEGIAERMGLQYPIDPASLVHGANTLAVELHNVNQRSDDIGFEMSLTRCGTSSGSTCGNSFPETAEQCDDGNTLGGDCCSASCEFETIGSPCSDRDACSDADRCDGSGSCVSGPPLPVDDGVPCTLDECVEPTGVVHVPDDLFCDDGDACTADACDEMAGCSSTRIPYCGVPIPSMPFWGYALLVLMLLVTGRVVGFGPISGSRHT